MAQGKALTPEEKKAIVALKQYFDRTVGDLEEQEELSVQRVSNALGFGLSTVRKTMADYSRGVDFDKESIVYRGRPTASTFRFGTDNCPGIHTQCQ